MELCPKYLKNYKSIKETTQLKRNKRDFQNFQMVNKQKKRCSVFLIIREMPIKGKVRNHYIITGMAMSKKTDISICWQAEE